MKEQVLSVSQMEELVNLGIDVSKASMCWIVTRSGVQFLIPNKKDSILEDILENEYLIDSYTPTFTLQDILEMLPDIIVNHEVYIPVIQKNFCKYVHNDNPILHLEVANNTIEAAFNMLKWCKQNNYI